MRFEFELNHIIEKRKSLFEFDFYIVSLILLAGISWSYQANLSIVFGLLAIFLFNNKLTHVAEIKCPQCHSQFSSKWKILLGISANQCQHCQLSLPE